MKKQKFKNFLGFSILELLIGILVTSLMMGALYTSYDVVNKTYTQVSEKAKISRSSRDLVSMLMRDIRMAGYRYYVGQQTIEAFEERTSAGCGGEGMILPNTSYLVFEDGYADQELSHNPIVIRRNTLGYAPSDPDDDTEAITDNIDDPNISDQCCDQIQIVYEDFSMSSDADLLQPFKKYRITYFAERNNSGGETRYSVYKSVEAWAQQRDDAGACDWPVSGQWKSNCPECVSKELIRDHIEDMEFVPFDANGIVLKNMAGDFPTPEGDNDIRSRLFDITGVDVRLTFRSKDTFFKKTRQRPIKSLLDGRSNDFSDKYLRDSVIVTVHSRNIGSNLFQ